MKLFFLFFLSCSTCLFGQTYEVVLITMNQTDDHWKAVHAGALKARDGLKQQGINLHLTWVGPPTTADVDAQIRLVQEAIDRKVDGILIAPVDVHALVKPVEAAANARIPIVVLDSGLNSNVQCSFVHGDNFQGGSLAARWIGTLLAGKGKVAVLRSQKGKNATDQREQGFLSVIAGMYPGIQVISKDKFAGATFESAEKAASDLLQANGPDLDAIFTPNQIATAGMLAALRAAQLGGGKIRLVGYDASPAAVEAIKGGDLQGFVAQNPMRIGYLGTQALVKRLQGEPPEAEIETEAVMVTAKNIATPSIAELVEPPLAPSDIK
jgi:ribose transport system substrate-binding protein